MLDLTTNGKQFFLYRDGELIGTYDSQQEAYHALLVEVGEA